MPLKNIMDNGNEHDEGGEDLVGIMNVDRESSDKDESPNEHDESSGDDDESSDENDESSDENDKSSNKDGGEDLVDIMHVDGESSDEDDESSDENNDSDEDDESPDEDDESSDEDDESSDGVRLFRFETLMCQVEENDPSLLSINIGYNGGTPLCSVDWCYVLEYFGTYFGYLPRKYFSTQQ
jgi:hypothetical protein